MVSLNFFIHDITEDFFDWRLPFLTFMYIPIPKIFKHLQIFCAIFKQDGSKSNYSLSIYKVNTV